MDRCCYTANQERGRTREASVDMLRPQLRMHEAEEAGDGTVFDIPCSVMHTVLYTAGLAPANPKTKCSIQRGNLEPPTRPDGTKYILSGFASRAAWPAAFSRAPQVCITLRQTAGLEVSAGQLARGQHSAYKKERK